MKKPRKLKSARRNWTKAQIQIIRDNPGRAVAEVIALVNEVGPPRTASAVDSKRAEQRVKGRRPVQHPSPANNAGWPALPWPAEIRDDVFVDAYVRAARAEGLLKIVRSAA